jgi:hypothetical protein
VKSAQVHKISDEAEAIQSAVKILFSNPCFDRNTHPQLEFFLQNRLEKTDFEILNALPLRGRANYLAERFRSYLDRKPRKQPG